MVVTPQSLEPGTWRWRSRGGGGGGGGEGEVEVVVGSGEVVGKGTGPLAERWRWLKRWGGGGGGPSRLTTNYVIVLVCLRGPGQESNPHLSHTW